MFLKNLVKHIDDKVNIDTTLQEVVDKMFSLKLHHIVIVKDKKPIGIITERDIVRHFKNRVDFNKPAIGFAVKNLLMLHETRLIEHALSMMIDNNIRKIVIVNSLNQYVGCLEQEEIVFFFEKEIESFDSQLNSLIKSDNRARIVDKDTNLVKTLELMEKESLTSILVSVDNTPVGIVTESDILSLAKEQVNHELKISKFMHSPIITMDITSTANKMISLMKEENIRRVVVHDPVDDHYHILNSKDVVNELKGNYTSFLESKLSDVRDTFNALGEYIIELIDLGDEQVIYWTNSITKNNFDINIDDDITRIIPEDIWKTILSKLVNEKIYFDTLKIKESYFQIKAHYGSVLNDNIIKIFLSDVTDIYNLNEKLKKQNKYQEELLYSQAKMAQLGEMIGNIAHQWRQPLSIISTAASGLQLKNELGMMDNGFFNETLDEIENSAQYLSRTIDTFRDFIKEKKELKEVVLQERIEKALKIVQTSLRNNHISLYNNIDEIEPIKVKLILGELSQVIINIINNAKDALKENNIKNPWVKIDLIREKEDVIITIEDNAEGIPENIISKIFDPYFTTKSEMQGTGLGLHMSRKIVVESLRGDLYVKNTQNGAKFYIKLPLSE